MKNKPADGRFFYGTWFPLVRIIGLRPWVLGTRGRTGPALALCFYLSAVPGKPIKTTPAETFQTMLKSSILNYNTSLKNSIKSSWVTLSFIVIIFVPAALFVVGFIFESEIAAFVMSVFPPSPRQGSAFYRDLVYLARTEILWLGFFSLVFFILTVYPSQAALKNFLNVRLKKKAVYHMMILTSAFFLTTILIGSEILERFPNSSDEYAYLFQAEMLSRGKLWEAAHDLRDFFYVNNIAQHDGILVSRFPPGWPLVLSAAFDVGLHPALINPLLGLAFLIVFYFFTKRYYGKLVAFWSLIAVAFTGYYIFSSSSYFSHVSCLLVVMLFVCNIYLYQEKNNFIYGLLAGFFLGFAVVIRYYTALLIFVPFLVYLLMQYRWKATYLFVWMAIGSIPCLAYLFWYNYSITGNSFMPVTVWAYPEEQLGFVKGHSFLKGIEHLIRWMLLFFYWCSPGLIILYIVFLWRKIKTPAERFVRPEDYAFVALIIGYFFYYQIGGNQYGPRFLFEAFPFLAVFVLNKVLQVKQRWAMALLIASLVYAVVKLPFIAYREALIVDERQDLYDLVEKHKVRNAIVFVASPTSPTRPMPADDLTRNDPRFLNDVIYALELPNINSQLINYYNDRAVYKYIRDVDHPHGELIKIR